MAAADSVHLIKYQALGNDYLVVDLPIDPDPLIEALPRICDRHRGLGSDGLIMFDPRSLAVRVFNPDGSESGRSGNGLRIAACHAVLEHGLGPEFELLTRDRTNPIAVLDVAGAAITCRLDLGPAMFEPDAAMELVTPAGTVRGRVVDLGNPHYVVLGEPVTPERCVELGPLLERDRAFPQRTNVQLAEAIGVHEARIEIWERGAGRTLASGTSAAAAAAALIRERRCEPPVLVRMPGGSLEIGLGPGGRLLQTGPARRVYRAELVIAELE